MFDEKRGEEFKETLSRTLDDSLYSDEILAAVQADALAIEDAAKTLSIIFMDVDLAHQLSQYSEFIYGVLRDLRRPNAGS